MQTRTKAKFPPVAASAAVDNLQPADVKQREALDEKKRDLQLKRVLLLHEMMEQVVQQKLCVMHYELMMIVLLTILVVVEKVD